MSPFRILQARAEARALLYAANEFDLDEALAPLRAYAIESGIVDEIGAEEALNLIHRPFGLADEAMP